MADSASQKKIVQVLGGEGLSAELRVGKHVVRIDEPVDLGGGDTGPTPYDLIAGALGACTAITLRMYADRKGWPLTGVKVTLSHAKIHARDCADCETKEGKLDQLEKVVILEGPLTDEQRVRLMDIAKRCPVQRTLETEIRIVDR